MAFQSSSLKSGTRAVALTLAVVSAGRLIAGCGGQTGGGGAYGNNGYTDPSLGGGSGSPMMGTPKGVAPIPNVAVWPVIDGKRAFLSGINVACFGAAKGHDLGKDPLHPDSAVWYKGDAVDAALKGFATSGFNVVRVTLFEGGQGLTFDKAGLTSGLDPAFSKNLADLVQKAQKDKLKLYLCFVDTWSDLAAKGMKDPITDAKAQDAYVKKALTPLARKLKANDSVFAFDVYNQVDAAVAGDDGNGTKKGATWDQAREFLKANMKAIKETDPQRLLTASCGLHGTQTLQKGFFHGLGFDFYDIHVFDDRGQLPTVSQLNLDRPIFLGAFGPSTKPVSDQLQADTDSAFIENAVTKGFSGYVAGNYGGSASDSLMKEDGKPRPAYIAIEKLLVEKPR